MNPRVALASIERRLKELGISADAASKAAGAPDSIRNLRRIVSGKAGSKELSVRNLTKLARYLDIPLPCLIGEEPIDEDVDKLDVDELLELQQTLMRRVKRVHEAIDRALLAKQTGRKKIR